MLLLFGAVPQSFPVLRDSTSAIYIVTHDNEVEAFRTMGRILISEGYDLEDFEEALLILPTKVRLKEYGAFNLGKLALRFQAEVLVPDTITVIKLTGKFLENVTHELSSREFDENALNIGSDGAWGSGRKSAWNYMMEIAKRYKNGAIKTGY